MKDTSCLSGCQSRVYHSLFVYSNIPEEFQYYWIINFDGYSSANYCPVSIGERSTQSKNIYYLGHFSDKKDSDVYDHNIYYEIGKNITILKLD